MATRSTTILAVKHKKKIAIGGDGQVTIGDQVMKHKAQKIRKLYNGKVFVGFAGVTADAFALLERFEKKLEEYQGNIYRAATELAKEWRTDKVLRRLESMMLIADKNHLLLISGSGDVLEPDDGVVGIGSGGAYAMSAARALVKHSKLSAAAIVKEALLVASDICIYTNKEIYVEEIK